MSKNKTLEQFSKEQIKSQLQFDCVLAQFQKKYAIINRNGKVFIVHFDDRLGYIFSDVESFHAINMHYSYTEKVADSVKVITHSVTRAFMKSQGTKRLSGIIFDPRLDPTTGTDNSVDYMNLWKGWNYRSIKGDVAPFLELVDINTNFNELGSEYLLNWLAHSIQKPAEIPMTAIVVKGAQGTGKGTLFVNTVGALTDSTKHLTSTEMLSGQFNGHLADAFYLIADELLFGGNHSEANKLKTMISEKSRMVNDKMKTAYSVEAYTRVIILSNNDFIVHVEEGDRRFVVFEASAKYKGNFEYFNKYQKYLKSGGFEAILDYLKNRDISNFNPLNIPNTSEKAELKLKSAPKPVQYLYEYLNGDVEIDESAQVGNKIYRNALYTQYIEWMKQGSPSAYRSSATEFGKTVAKAFEFDLDSNDWRTNWKDKKGYFYTVNDKPQMLERFAKNMLNTDAKSVFVTYQLAIDEQIRDTDNKIRRVA